MGRARIVRNTATARLAVHQAAEKVHYCWASQHCHCHEHDGEQDQDQRKVNQASTSSLAEWRSHSSDCSNSHAVRQHLGDVNHPLIHPPARKPAVDVHHAASIPGDHHVAVAS